MTTVGKYGIVTKEPVLLFGQIILDRNVFRGSQYLNCIDTIVFGFSKLFSVKQFFELCKAFFTVGVLLGWLRIKLYTMELVKDL